MTINIEPLAELIINTQTLTRLRQQAGQQRRTASIVPEFSRPIASVSNFEVFGKRNGMAGREVELLIHSLMLSEDEYENETIKKLLMVAKIRNPECLEPYRQEYEQRQSRYQMEMDRYEKAKQNYEIAIARIEEMVNRPHYVDLRVAWADIVDQTIAALAEVGNNPDLLSPDDALFFDVLDKSSRHIVKGKDPETGTTTIEVDWDTIRSKLHPEHVAGIFRKWIKTREELEKAKQPIEIVDEQN